MGSGKSSTARLCTDPERRTLCTGRVRLRYRGSARAGRRVSGAFQNRPSHTEAPFGSTRIPAGPEWTPCRRAPDPPPSRSRPLLGSFQRHGVSFCRGLLGATGRSLGFLVPSSFCRELLESAPVSPAPPGFPGPRSAVGFSQCKRSELGARGRTYVSSCAHGTADPGSSGLGWRPSLESGLDSGHARVVPSCVLPLPRLRL